MNTRLQKQAMIDEIKRSNDSDALVRANRIIGWMANYLGRMAPPNGGIMDLNEHWLYMERTGRHLPSDGTDARHGRPLDQRAQR